MRNVLLRKGLVLGIICFLMLMSSPLIPVLNALGNKSNGRIANNQNYELPDLKIVDIKWKADEYMDPGEFHLKVKNVGIGAVPGGGRIKSVRIFVVHRFLPKLISEAYQSSGGGTFPPQMPGYIPLLLEKHYPNPDFLT